MGQTRSAVQFILDTVEDGFFEVDLAGNMLLCNRALADIMGYSVPELIGRNYTEYMSPDTARKVFQIFNGVFRTGRATKRFEWELIRRDGSSVWVETSVSLVTDDAGRASGFRGILRDVTSRKHIQERLASQLELEKLVARIGQILFMSDESTLDVSIDTALAELGRFVAADRSYLFLYSQDLQKMSNTHEWCAPGITPEKDNLQDLPVDAFPWWMEQLFAKPYLYIPCVGELPPEAASEKQLLEVQGIQSLLVVPVPWQDNKLLGFMGFDAVKERKEWSEDSIRLLSIAAQFIAHAIQQCRSTRLLQESSRFLQDIVDFFPDPFFAIDAEGAVTVWNHAMEELTGIKASNVLGRSNFECALPFYGYRRPMLAHLAMSYRQEDLVLYNGINIERETLTVETAVPLMPGKILWAKAKPLRDRKGRIKGAIQSIHDITYRVEIENRLKQALSELEAVLEAMPDLYVRLRTDGTVLDLKTGYNIPRDILVCDMPEPEKGLFEIFVAPLARQLEQALSVMAEKRQATVFHVEYSNSDERHVQVHLVPLFHNEAVAVIQDITEQHRYTKYLQEMSLYDRLTKVYNRNAFQEKLAKLAACPDDFPVGIMVCDVDGLKLVNDVLGHLAGDCLLETFACILKQCFEDNADIFRTGGDEFVVMLPHHDYEVMRARHRELEAAVESYNDANPDLPLGISVGIAACNEPGTLSQALEKADSEMYQAKLRQHKGNHPYLKQTLMHALADRDFLAQGHGDRLQKATLLLAKAAGVPSNRLNELRLLAYFHDIGKLRIPEHILAKPGPLTLEERREIAKHCSIGHRIALSAPELAPIAEWILHHHERWDGSGYPLGLKGADIPLESRILSIADAYDAITNDRPYRKARSREEAVAELKACAGTQFDPELVELFISVVLPAIDVSS